MLQHTVLLAQQISDKEVVRAEKEKRSPARYLHILFLSRAARKQIFTISADREV